MHNAIVCTTVPTIVLRIIILRNNIYTLKKLSPQKLLLTRPLMQTCKKLCLTDIVRSGPPLHIYKEKKKLFRFI